MLQDLIVWIITIALGWFARMIYIRKKYSWFRFVRKFKVFQSGAQGYYYSFHPEDNKKAWEEIKNEFCYLGVSTNTIIRSEEHTSELQSHSFISYAVFCLKKKTHNSHTIKVDL